MQGRAYGVDVAQSFNPDVQEYTNPVQPIAWTDRERFARIFGPLQRARMYAQPGGKLSLFQVERFAQAGGLGRRRPAADRGDEAGVADRYAKHLFDKSGTIGLLGHRGSVGKCPLT
jgi:hypothetical protein